jgi:hypothetical protein
MNKSKNYRRNKKLRFLKGGEGEGLGKTDVFKTSEPEPASEPTPASDPASDPASAPASKEEIKQCRDEITQEINELNEKIKDANKRLKDCGSIGVLGMGNLFGFLGGKKSCKNKSKSKKCKNKTKSKKCKK